MKKTIFTLTIVSAVLAASLTGCGVKIAEITMPDMQVKAGQTDELAPSFSTGKDTASDKLQKAIDKLELVYTSADDSIASVDAEGVVTGVKAGETTVTIATEDGKLSATAKVVVVAVPESVEANDITLTVGQDPVKVEYTLLPNGVKADKVELSVKDEAIAKVEKDTIAPVATGETELTIKADDAQTTVKVTVNDAETQTEEDTATDKQEATASGSTSANSNKQNGTTQSSTSGNKQNSTTTSNNNASVATPAPTAKPVQNNSSNNNTAPAPTQAPAPQPTAAPAPQPTAAPAPQPTQAPQEIPRCGTCGLTLWDNGTGHGVCQFGGNHPTPAPEGSGVGMDDNAIIPGGGVWEGDGGNALPPDPLPDDF